MIVGGLMLNFTPFRNKLIPPIEISKWTYFHGLLAEPTELDKSNLRGEHFPKKCGADITTVGTSAFVGKVTATVTGLTDFQRLQLVWLLGQIAVTLSEIMFSFDGNVYDGEGNMFIVYASIHWQEDFDSPVKLNMLLHGNRLMKPPLLVSESKWNDIKVASPL